MKLLDRSDRYKLAGALLGVALWWYYIGSGKYSMKGMTKHV
jgi:hypothetical protein